MSSSDSRAPERHAHSAHEHEHEHGQGSAAPHGAADSAEAAAEHWESRYAGSDRVWSGRVNRVLADTIAGLVPERNQEPGRERPSRALDLGCGEGGDAVWLAQRGWDVTGIDLSPTAVTRARQAALELGISEERLRFEAADLATWEPRHDFELVTCSFLHAWPVYLPREEILRRSAGFVAPGGYLLVTAHAAPPPGADPETVANHRFPTPEDDLQALDLDADEWEVLTCERRERDALDPNGQRTSHTDGVVLVQRNH